MDEEELIARLEKSEGSDRGLDLAIMFVVDRDRYEWCERQYRALWMRAQDNGLHDREEACRNSGFSSVPCYTRSIDDALTLVPPWSWRVGNLPSGRGFADLGTQPSLQCIEGATPAIALCIASLRARAALKAATDSAGGAGNGN